MNGFSWFNLTNPRISTEHGGLIAYGGSLKFSRKELNASLDVLSRSFDSKSLLCTARDPNILSTHSEGGEPGKFGRKEVSVKPFSRTNIVIIVASETTENEGMLVRRDFKLFFQMQDVSNH
jgi:hypothetical protein